MNDWKTLLKADPTEWLLEEENPSVRYFTLCDVLGKPPEDAAVRSAKHSIMQTGLVPELLARQREAAYLKADPQFYTSKYKGLVWSLIVLAELGAEANGQIKSQCEYLLCTAQERGDGGFAMHEAVKTGGGRITEVIPCLTGNLVWCLVRFGYLDDPRVQKGIDWITRFTRLNDGVEEDPQQPPYN